MFRLHLLYKNPNVHLLKQLTAFRSTIQAERIGFLHQSAANKRSSSTCESRPLTSDGMQTNCMSTLKQSIREQVNTGNDVFFSRENMHLDLLGQDL